MVIMVHRELIMVHRETIFRTNGPSFGRDARELGGPEYGRWCSDEKKRVCISIPAIRFWTLERIKVQLIHCAMYCCTMVHGRLIVGRCPR
jgi:hypothetical protein